MIRNISINNKDFIYDQNTPIKSRSRIADVFVGSSGNKKYLIKKIKPEAFKNESLYNKVLTEHKINCEYFGTEFCQSIQINNELFILRPFLEGQTLENTINSRNLKKNKIVFFIEIWKKTLEQLQILHLKNIIHRDIKPSNILLSYDDNPQVYLIDFGQSNYIDLQQYENRIPFSLIYSPPEQVLNFPQLCGYHSDFYALGISFFELFSGKKAFSHFNAEMLMNLMISMPLDLYEIKINEIQNIIGKSTFKSSLGKPPSYFSHDQLLNFISKDVNQRYQNCTDYIDDLQILLFGIQQKKQKNNIFKRLIYRM